MHSFNHLLACYWESVSGYVIIPCVFTSDSIWIWRGLSGPLCSTLYWFSGLLSKCWWNAKTAHFIEIDALQKAKKKIKVNLDSSVNILKSIELYPSKGWTSWYVNFYLAKALKKKVRGLLKSVNPQNKEVMLTSCHVFVLKPAWGFR